LIQHPAKDLVALGTPTDVGRPSERIDERVVTNNVREQVAVILTHILHPFDDSLGSFRIRPRSCNRVNDLMEVALYIRKR
jgi:hypothetical protein